jgi:hypothetical protein
MIKSNWPIENLIMLLGLIFMQIRPIIIFILERKKKGEFEE